MEEKELPVYIVDPTVSSIVSCIDEEGNLLSMDIVEGSNTRNVLNNMQISYNTKRVFIEFKEPIQHETYFN